VIMIVGLKEGKTVIMIVGGGELVVVPTGVGRGVTCESVGLPVVPPGLLVGFGCGIWDGNAGAAGDKDGGAKALPELVGAGVGLVLVGGAGDGDDVGFLLLGVTVRFGCAC
jgi:hypothetical protein